MTQSIEERQPTTPPKKDWEEEYDDYCRTVSPTKLGGIQIVEIKSFIRQTIDIEREKAYKEGYRERDKQPSTIITPTEEQAIEFALQAERTRLREEIEKMKKETVGIPSTNQELEYYKNGGSLIGRLAFNDGLDKVLSLLKET